MTFEVHDRQVHELSLDRWKLDVELVPHWKVQKSSSIMERHEKYWNFSYC